MPLFAAALAAGMISDWATYAMTSLELSTALHGDGSLWAMFLAVMAAFMPTQFPLGIAEGVVTALAYRFVLDRRPELLGACPDLRVDRRDRRMNACDDLGRRGQDGGGKDGRRGGPSAPGSPTSTPIRATCCLFLFLLAGAIGGFIMGYTFRGCFRRESGPGGRIGMQPRNDKTI